MRQAASTRTRNPLARLLGWAGFGLMIVMLWLGQSGSSQARLDPYFVVRGNAFGGVKPRVLVVLDTSGSMAFRADDTNERCSWGDCEDPSDEGTANESRLAAARRSFREVIAGSSDAASFSLMTFVQNAPESQASPPMCDYFGDSVRFVYVTDTNSDGWQPFDRGGGYDGMLRICQGAARRPYAYIRWDFLGGMTAGGTPAGHPSDISANNQSGAIPDSPLVSLAQADYINLDMMRRPVQWFPEFMGVRVQLNGTTDPGGTIAAATVGDYTAADVTGHDFYYWPYVDGFPGYGQWRTRYDVSGTTTEFLADGSSRAGVSDREDWFEGVTLHSPFYLDLSDTAVPPADWGPSDEAESLAISLGRTAPLVEGGVDAVGGTPWADAIGDVDDPYPEVNNPGEHPTVVSYLNFLTTTVTASACTPTSLVLLTDGEPSSGQGGDVLYERLAEVRNRLDVDTYVVGFLLGTEGELNDMACAAAGACDGGSGCSSPCDDDPAAEWDTCANPGDPANACAYVASSTEELREVLSAIIDIALETEIDSGPGAAVNEFGAEGLEEGVVAVQTVFSASTDYPGWQGHVERRYCDIRDASDDLVPTCVPPVPEFPPEVSGAFNTFGPCAIGRDWDAGECLLETPWYERRIYSHDASNNVYRISEADGTASATFIAELTTLGYVAGASAEADADEIAAFVLGRDAPGETIAGYGGWKLPGVSNSAPIVVRRVPEYNEQRLPEVGINDPHCAGRRFGDLDAGSLPDSLETFSQDSWDEDDAPNYPYQEAVIVGDDWGIIHAFQLDSGNEIFGLLPRFAIENAVASAANGPTNMGQPAEDLDDHIFGVSSTLNHGWAYDEGATRWRHLGVIGMGAGGHEYIALDLSHMHPDLGVPPVDVLWTTEDALLAPEYDDMLGETWARPALTYHVQNDELAFEPETFLVAGSGYPEGGGDPAEGRSLFVANALTGEILERATLPVLVDPVYESTFGTVVDPAVASHCISRYWAEGQEAYVTDPAGRLFRWDLGRDTTPLTFKHDADSGGAPWVGAATQLHRFPACTGTGASCSVNAGNPGDPFIFGPSISAFNRLDDVTGGALSPVEENNQFLVALISGSPYEDTLDGGDPDNDFHSSMYLLVDDRDASPGPDEGFDIPAGSPTSGGAFGAGDAVTGNPGYMRIAVSDVTRTRTVTPFPGAVAFTETRRFSKAARPIRPPRMYVTGVADTSGDTPVIVEDVEIFYITYYIYEPGAGECDPRFYDAANNEWHPDRGSTYQITFRLAADRTTGFEFNSGASGGGTLADFEAGFNAGLVLESVEQETEGDCESGNCGAQVNPETFVPCDNNPPADEPISANTFVIPMASKTLDAFTPVEN